MSQLRIQFPILALLILISSIPARAQSQPSWKGSIVKEGDIIVIKNPKEPIYKAPILELEEDLSLGGPGAEGEYAFGGIRNLVVDDKGSIYVLDGKNSRTQVFDAEGKYVMSIGRKGQGPGDLDTPLSLCLNRTSDELLVLQAARRLSFFRTGGAFVRQLDIPDSIRAQIDSRGQIYLLEPTRSREGEWTYDLKKIAAFGTSSGVLASAPGQGYTGKINPFIGVSSFKVDRDDNLVYGDPRTYELLFYEPSKGKVFKKITLDYAAVPVSEKDRAAELAKLPPAARAYTSFVFPKYHPAFASFFLSDLGHIFVRTKEDTNDGKSIYDVFDREGRFISRMPLRPAGITILAGKYYALEEDDGGYQCVKRYAVTWKTY